MNGFGHDPCIGEGCWCRQMRQTIPPTGKESDMEFPAPKNLYIPKGFIPPPMSAGTDHFADFIEEQEKVIKRLLSEKAELVASLSWMLRRMKLINGDDSCCVKKPVECENHAVITQAERLLERIKGGK